MKQRGLDGKRGVACIFRDGSDWGDADAAGHEYNIAGRRFRQCKLADGAKHQHLAARLQLIELLFEVAIADASRQLHHSFFWRRGHSKESPRLPLYPAPLHPDTILAGPVVEFLVAFKDKCFYVLTLRTNLLERKVV